MRRIKRPICSITGLRSTSLRPNRQNSRNPARCQETTVSGWTMIKASDQRSHNRRSTIQNHRSWGSSLGRGLLPLDDGELLAKRNGFQHDFVAWREEGTQVSDYCTGQGHHLPISVDDTDRQNVASAAA